MKSVIKFIFLKNEFINYQSLHGPNNLDNLVESSMSTILLNWICVLKEVLRELTKFFFYARTTVLSLSDTFDQ